MISCRPLRMESLSCKVETTVTNTKGNLLILRTIFNVLITSTTTTTIYSILPVLVYVSSLIILSQLHNNAEQLVVFGAAFEFRQIIFDVTQKFDEGLHVRQTGGFQELFKILAHDVSDEALLGLAIVTEVFLGGQRGTALFTEVGFSFHFDVERF